MSFLSSNHRLSKIDIGTVHYYNRKFAEKEGILRKALSQLTNVYY